MFTELPGIGYPLRLLLLNCFAFKLFCVVEFLSCMFLLVNSPHFHQRWCHSDSRDEFPRRSALQVRLCEGVKPCHWLYNYQSYEETYCRQLQGERIPPPHRQNSPRPHIFLQILLIIVRVF